MSNPKGNVASLKPYQSKWNSGETKTIRVPVVLADQVLDYARKLDNGETVSQVIQVDSTKPYKLEDETLSQVIQMLSEALALKANAGGAIKGKIREAIALLQ